MVRALRGQGFLSCLDEMMAALVDLRLAQDEYGQLDKSYIAIMWSLLP
jgi:hypothetical protein